MTELPKNSDLDSDPIRIQRPLYLIVGDHSVSPCDHDTFGRFKLWVVDSLTSGQIDSYTSSNVLIEHWDAQAGDVYPHLLNPCECGTYLPIDIEPGPMLSSAIGLLTDLSRLIPHRQNMEPAFHPLFDTLLEMTNLSIEKNIPLEIR